MRGITLLCLFVFIGKLLFGANITFDVLYPASVQFDKGILKVGIIDRSVSEQSVGNIIEGIFTGEGLNQDKLSSQIALDGLSSLLQNTSRFEVVRTPEVMKSKKSSEQLAAPLQWQEIVKLCSKYKVDAIISLEAFDSDFVITSGQKNDQSSYFAAGVAQVHLGFRFYNPKNKSIADQYYYDYQFDWRSEKATPAEALAGLINRKKAIKEVSYNAGREYGRRISPSYYKVTREYFKRSKKDESLSEGARMMESNDWTAAVTALEQAFLNGHKKTKGKAAHNLAVVYEIIGELEKSKKYASLAWGKFKNKPSKDYAYQITRRMNQQNLVEQQLGMK